MGKLTDDMTRLRGEINGLYENRHILQRELTQAIETLRHDTIDFRTAFRQAHENMAASGRREREAFITDLTRQVNDLRSHVTDMLRTTADDLNGASRAWREQ
ncbi:hypothetical protein [Methylohalobius crimeensis]|uniref:hypothetical protein n=1 Tax=Methylohalobius crimeensis TaxID=244365 RepID=UPI0003B70189|nr:hypothetical protein [Methylohalobius crimeensis]